MKWLFIDNTKAPCIFSFKRLFGKIDIADLLTIARSRLITSTDHASRLRQPAAVEPAHRLPFIAAADHLGIDPLRLMPPIRLQRNYVQPLPSARPRRDSDFTAALTDALTTDSGSNGTLEPGDVIEYTAIITNTRAMDATAFTFDVTLDTPGETYLVYDGIAESGRVYRMVFDAARLSTGEYVYVLKFNGRLVSQRMLLVK
jgi:hypothetical protein